MYLAVVLDLVEFSKAIDEIAHRERVLPIITASASRCDGRNQLLRFTGPPKSVISGQRSREPRLAEIEELVDQAILGAISTKQDELEKLFEESIVIAQAPHHCYTFDLGRYASRSRCRTRNAQTVQARNRILTDEVPAL